ncbi:MAG TPA: VTT domain-containing protein [Solirubrobacteraceae bacterium]|nr:VTT domain-containing protein [Solirubrobacteraceae bacterium]
MTIAAAAGAMFALVAVLVPHSPSALSRDVAGYGWAAPALFAAVWAAVTPALFSGTVLATAAGLLFGPGLGTAVGVVGGTIGGLLSFAISRRWGAGALDELTSGRGDGKRRRLQTVQNRVNAKPFQAVMLLRLMPGMPATWLNYAIGLTRVRPMTFAAANALGSAPRVFIYAGLGAAASHGDTAVTAISIGLFCALGGGGVIAGIRERRTLRAAAHSAAGASTG